MALAMKVKKTLKFILKVIGTIILIIGLLYGHGILMKPRIEIACGAVDLAVTAKLKADLMFLSLLFAKQEIAERITNDFAKYLEEFGMSQEKIKLIIDKDNKKKAKLEEGKQYITESDLNLEPHEERIVMAAISKAMQGSTVAMAEQFSVPDSAAFFQVKNIGRTDAIDVHVVIRLNGKFVSDRIDSQNPIISKIAEGNKYEVNLKALSPGAKLKGMIWYERLRNKTLFETNSISVAYKDGLKEAKFEENIFVINN